MKLADLTPLIARIADISDARSRVLAMELRKRGLIRQAGRGLHAAEMTPADATNLLIAALFDGQATAAANDVATVRAVELFSFDFDPGDGGGLRDISPSTFAGYGSAILPPGFDRIPDTVGEMLDDLLGTKESLRSPWDRLEVDLSGGRIRLTVDLHDEDFQYHGYREFGDGAPRRFVSTFENASAAHEFSTSRKTIVFAGALVALRDAILNPNPDRPS